MTRIIKRRVVQGGEELPADLHPLLRRLYAARQLRCADDMVLELQCLHPPALLKGIDTAVALLHKHLQGNSRVLVVSDFDADGATSCALALRALRSFGFGQVDYIVPNRFEYGYGLTPEIVELARQRTPDLIITVDNGISSIEGVEAALAAGMEVLVTDHHLPGDRLPAAQAIVNPNQQGCSFPSKALAGVGVIFYLMLALRTQLRELGWFAEQALPEPNMASLLDLVALGTVADVVPLDRNNRILVNEGLRRIRQGRACPGITALLEAGRRELASVTATDLGFAAGPRLNAAGRLDDMQLGIECLLSDSLEEARLLAGRLDSINESRKQIETQMRDQAMAALQQMDLRAELLPPGLCIYNPDWHQGVIGILASRIKEQVHRPVIAFADAGGEGEPLLKGSARSVAGLHIRDVLDSIAVRHPGLISRFGGHAMAAGLSIRTADYQHFAAAFADEVARQLGDEAPQAVIYSDGELAAADLCLASAELLREAGPWGQGFPEPVFDGVFRVRQQRVLGGRHLKLVVSPLDSSEIIDAIAFNAPLSELDLEQLQQLHLVYRLDINEYRGRRSLQIMVEYLLPVAAALPA